MNGIIERIRIYPAKGSAGTELAEGRLIENFGLEGDFHAEESEKQVSLLSAQIRETADQKNNGLCFSRFQENLTVRCRELFGPGNRLVAGEAVLEITADLKHCHKECNLYKAGKRCSLAGMNLFARVLKSGIVRIGDTIDVL
jgi:MOSC domain-containing protein YiiM